MKLITLIAAALLAGSAQDPVSTLPDSYTLQFENEWVRVVRVHYAPHARLPAHAHTSSASAYVYLNDAGPVVFRHIGAAYGSATRPATKAGSFRLYRGLAEIHEVDNTSALASDFLRVEFKTDPKDEKTLRGKFHRETVPAGENLEKIQFENEQVRITRLICAPGKTLDLRTGDTQPGLLIALSAGRVSVARDQSEPVPLTLAMGQPRWIPVSHRERVSNVSEAAVELLRFDFKSPIRARESAQ